MRQREPCCWKCTSSMAHRSISAFLARMRSFFMRRLELGIGFRNLWARFAQSKTQLSKESLTLASFQRHAMLSARILRQGGAIPHLRRQANLGWRGSQGRLDFCQLTIAQPTGTSRSAERSEEHTSELQSRQYLVCRLLLEKKNIDRLGAHAAVEVVSEAILQLALH